MNQTGFSQFCPVLPCAAWLWKWLVTLGQGLLHQVETYQQMLKD
jgi:hypothetical protein